MGARMAMYANRPDAFRSAFSSTPWENDCSFHTNIQRTVQEIATEIKAMVAMIFIEESNQTPHDSSQQCEKFIISVTLLKK